MEQWAAQWLNVNKSETGWSIDTLWGHYVDSLDRSLTPESKWTFTRWLELSYGLKPYSSQRAFSPLVDGVGLRETPILASED